MEKMDLLFWLNRIIKASDDLSCPYCNGDLSYYLRISHDGGHNECKCELCNSIIRCDHSYDSDMESYTQIDYMNCIQELVWDLEDD